MTDASEMLSRLAGMVAGDRARTHGGKTETHQKIADLWNVFLRIRREPASPLSAEDVALMMALLKVARTQCGAFNLDDYLDLAGYGAVAGEIAAAVGREPAQS